MSEHARSRCSGTRWRPAIARRLAVALAAHALAVSAAGCRRADATADAQRTRLLEALSSRSIDERVAAARELARRREPAAVKPLMRLLHDARGEARLAAVSALGEIRATEAAAAVARLLAGSCSWDERRAAAEALGRIGDPASLPSLVRALRDEQSSVVFASATALARIGRPGVVALTNALARGNGALNMAVAHAMQNVTDRQAVAELRSLAGKGSIELRLAAVKSLCGLRDADSICRIVPLLADPNAKLRKGVRESLIGMKTAAVQPLASALRRDAAATDAPGGPNVRRAILDVLQQIGGAAVVAPLLAAMDDPDPGVRSSADKALRVVMKEAEPAREALNAIRDGPSRRRLNAMRVIEPRDDRDVLAALGEAVRDEEVAVRLQTLDVLDRVWSDAASALLVPALRDGEPAVRARAAAALAARGRTEGRDTALEILTAGATESGAGASRGDPDRTRDRELVHQAIEALVGLGDASVHPLLTRLLAHPDARTVELAVRAVGRTGQPDAAVALVPLLRSPDAGVVRAAIEVLGSLHDSRSVPDLVALLDSGPPGMALPVIEALGRIGHRSAAPALIEVARGKERHLLRAAVQALGRTRDPAAVPVLASFLKAGGVPQGVVIQALGDVGDAAALPHLAPLFGGNLHDAGSRENGSTAMNQAFAAVGRIGGPQAFALLADAVRRVGEHHWWTPLRMRVVRAMAEADPHRAVDELVALARRTEPLDVSQFAQICAILGQTGDRRAIRTLLDLLQHDLPEPKTAAVAALEAIGRRDPGVLIESMAESNVADRSAIAIVCGQIGRPVQPAVTKALKDPAPEVRQGAAWALGHMQCRDAVPSLLDVLRDPHPDVRGGAAWALGSVGDPAAIEPLLRAAADPDPKPRAGAVEALAAFGDPRAVQTVTRSLGDSNSLVRVTAIAAVARNTNGVPAALLSPLLNDRSADVRAAAKRTLDRLAKETPARIGPAKPARVLSSRP